MADAFKVLAGGLVAVAKGTYWLGDTRGAFSYDEWDILIKDAGYFLDQPLGRAGGIQALAFIVQKGNYKCEAGEIAVYADTVGLVPERPGQPLPRWMHAVELAEGDTCSRDGPVVRFGRFVLDTVEMWDAPAPPRSIG